MPGPFEQLSQDLASACAVAKRGLVQICIGQNGIGSGAIWHPNGLVVTNAHVVQTAGAARRSDLSVVLPDQRQLPARILGTDSARDLAVLHVNATNLPTIPLGDSRRLRPGDIVTALGFPWGVHGGATSGIVIGIGVGLPEVSTVTEDWIVASLSLRPGHSGGPLLDSASRLVGINTLMTGPKVGAAIPVHVAVSYLKQLLARKTDPIPEAPVHL